VVSSRVGDGVCEDRAEPGEQLLSRAPTELAPVSPGLEEGFLDHVGGIYPLSVGNLDLALGKQPEEAPVPEDLRFAEAVDALRRQLIHEVHDLASPHGPSMAHALPLSLALVPSCPGTRLRWRNCAANPSARSTFRPDHHYPGAGAHVPRVGLRNREAFRCHRNARPRKVPSRSGPGLSGLSGRREARSLGVSPLQTVCARRGTADSSDRRGY
jgi:hypothetical protein